MPTPKPIPNFPSLAGGSGVAAHAIGPNDLMWLVDADTGNPDRDRKVTVDELDARTFSIARTFTEHIKFNRVQGLGVTSLGDPTGTAIPALGLSNTMPPVIRMIGHLIILGGSLASVDPFTLTIINSGMWTLLVSNIPSAYTVSESGGSHYSRTDDSLVTARCIVVVWDGTSLTVIVDGQRGAAHIPHGAVALSGSLELKYNTPEIIRCAGDATILLGNPDLDFSSGSAMRWVLTAPQTSNITFDGTFTYITALGVVTNNVATTKVVTDRLIHIYWDGLKWMIHG